MKRKLALLMALCMIATLITACAGDGKPAGQTGGAPVKLVIAARGGSHVDAINSVKAAFESENNCTIEVLGLEAADLKQKVSLDSQNKVGAYDLAMADDPWMPELYEANIFANLTKLGYKADTDFVKASLAIGMHPYGNGDIYSLPFAGNVQLFFYNQKLFEDNKFEIPDSWEGALEIAKAINGKDGKVGYVIRGQQGNPIVSDYLPVLWAYGGNVFDDNWNVIVDSKEAKDALKMYIDLLANGANYEKNDIVAAVSDGKAAMSLGWPSWYISGETASAAYAPIPGKALKSSKQNATGMIGNWMMGVTANSANKELAMKFLVYATSAEAQKTAVGFGGVPTRVSVFTDSKLLEKYPYFTAIHEGTENSVIRPRTPKWTDAETAYGAELSNAISGTKSIDQALADAKTAIEAIMKK
ncbi:MAG: extracellular solute-binding protein [Ruminiclostridium sp.]|nr:extracellular solute-binding protein [Ruminiclostridium sp.]